MNLSTSGRVVIIDDLYEESRPLLEVLGKDRIPYVYLDGKPEHLPYKPFSGIRFVFMDIELGRSFVGQSVKTKASGITAVLKKTIAKRNGPYVIIAWTRHTEVIQQVIHNCQESGIPPVHLLDLEKSECFKSDNVIDYLSKKLSNILKEIGAFQLYVDWENMLNASGKIFISEFSGYFPIDNNWSKNNERLFYKLYKSYVEKNELSDKNEQVRCSLHLLNRSYLDSLENKTSSYMIPDNFRLTGGEVNKEVISKLNTSLFIIENPNTLKSTGSIYLENKRKLLSNLKEICFNKSSDFPKDFRLCKMIITPDCDIAQKKFIAYRILKGILYRDCNETASKHSPQEMFEIGPFWYKNKACRIIFNFQTISSCLPDEINDSKRLFAVKRDLLFDIQSKAANHVNRLGNYQLK